MARELLNQVKIAAPCPASWHSMKGDDKVRFCGLCKLTVYNVAEMTPDEAESLIRETEGRLCMRLYKRKDGTVLTRNCPVGVHAMWKRMRYAAALVLALVFGSFSLAMAKLRSDSDDSHLSLVERARSWPVIGPVIEKLDPQEGYTAGALSMPVPTVRPTIGP
jgi:hypothetical protein